MVSKIHVHVPLYLWLYICCILCNTSLQFCCKCKIRNYFKLRKTIFNFKILVLVSICHICFFFNYIILFVNVCYDLKNGLTNGSTLICAPLIESNLTTYYSLVPKFWNLNFVLPKLISVDTSDIKHSDKTLHLFNFTFFDILVTNLDTWQICIMLTLEELC